MSNPDTTDLSTDRRVLKYAIQRAIFCPMSGRILDIRKSVLFTVTNAEGVAASKVVDGEVWDTLVDKLTAVATEQNVKLEVIDGRIVNARKKKAS